MQAGKSLDSIIYSNFEDIPSRPDFRMLSGAGHSGIEKLTRKERRRPVGENK
jgi:hypothetical protein